MSEEIRSFLAIETTEEIRAKLLEAQRDLSRVDADVRWTPREQMHLTLKFLGGVPEENLKRFEEWLRNSLASFGALDLSVAGVGTFGGRSPRIVWAGCSGDVERCKSLAAICENGALEIGVAKEERPFSPHVTIGRVKSPRNVERLKRAVERHKDDAFGTMKASDIVLFKSEPRPSGAVYSPLARVAL